MIWANGGIAQLVERCTGSAKARDSNSLTSTIRTEIGSSEILRFAVQTLSQIRNTAPISLRSCDPNRNNPVDNLRSFKKTFLKGKRASVRLESLFPILQIQFSAES